MTAEFPLKPLSTRDPNSLQFTPGEWRAMGFEGEDSLNYADFPVQLWVKDSDGGITDNPEIMSLHVGVPVNPDERDDDVDEEYAWGRIADMGTLFEDVADMYKDSPEHAACAAALLRGWADRIEQAARDYKNDP